ncbi:MAG TPA: DUF5667 domain-containing protein [Nocardioides sp.]|uniref:DUF5667 domain-containing protein n=1 Tax=Nocardioides sp. TaxID=35761 RepID=UPI002F42A8D5
MITGRRAQQFHELVEGASTGGARLPEYADLLEVVGALRAVPEPVADPEFVATLRERLLAEAESVLAAAAAERDDTDARLRLRPTTPRTRRRNRRLAAVVSGVALVGASATMAVASQSALPGDGLYSVKRGIESAHAELTFDRGDRGRVLLSSAGTRLDEAEELSREHADSTRVDQALDAFTQQAIDGSDLLVADYEATGDRTSITALRSFTATSMGRLEALQSEIPSQSLESLLQAAQALDQVQQTSVHTCPSCPGPMVSSMPSVLVHASRSTVDTWQVAAPKPRHHGIVHEGSDGGPQLPDLPSKLPPASVTDPDTSSADPGETQPPTAGDVQHTVKHLTDGLSDGQQNDVASTVSDTTNNLLDAVGEVGNQVTDTLDQTVGGIQSALPTLP